MKFLLSVLQNHIWIHLPIRIEMGGTREQVKQRGDGGRNENRKYPRLSECSSTVILTWGGGHCGWRTGAGGSGGGGGCFGGREGGLQASCLGTPCTAHFLPAYWKNAQLHFPSAKKPAQSTQTSPETVRQAEHFIPSTVSHFLPDSSRWLLRENYHL